MKRLALIAVLASGCVDGLEPAELGLGRRLGVYPGEAAAVLPPMTDRAGNIYVATGIPDATGAPQPGVALTGGARGGWSQECATGEGPLGAARGWIGASVGRGWLWTGTAILELDARTGTCATKLDLDPVSAADLHVLAAAPFVQETVSGPFALAMIATASDPTPHLVTIDLELGVIRDSTKLPGATVLGAGADHDGAGVFLIREASATRLVFAKPHAGVVASIPVSGTAGVLAGEIVVGSDGSIAAVIDQATILIGDRSGIRVEPVTGAIAIERDDDGAAWLIARSARGPEIAAITDGAVGALAFWSCAADVDAALRAGVVVIDESSGQRTASMWQARSALGGAPLLAPRLAPPYAVGARAWLVADEPIDRGGIPYSQLAVVPVGVTFR